jgi:aerobic carbon-monoxide dehydrogenase small subunit
MRISLNINNYIRDMEIEAGDVLYDALNKLGFTSVRKSCDTGSCGACTVLVDGKPVPSCSYLAVRADGKNITTIEGVKSEAERFNNFILDEGAAQCGYCNPGFILTVLAMKDEVINPTEEDIKNYMVGNLCRCSGYVGHLRAIKKYLEAIK